MMSASLIEDPNGQKGSFTFVSTKLKNNNSSSMLDRESIANSFTIVIPSVLYLQNPYSSLFVPQMFLVDDQIFRIKQFGHILTISSSIPALRDPPIQRETKRLERTLLSKPYCNLNNTDFSSRRTQFSLSRTRRTL